MAAGAFAFEFNECVAGALQLGDFRIERLNPLAGKFAGPGPVVAFVQLQQLADFLQREARGLRLADEPEAAQILAAVRAEPAAARRRRKQPLALVEADGLHAYAAGRRQPADGERLLDLTLYHGTDPIWVAASDQPERKLPNMLDKTQPLEKRAVLYRMVMEKHTCPYGIKVKYLLEREGYVVEDHHLTTREATDAFKAEHGAKTTPQVFIDGKRIGGHDDTRRFLGKKVFDPNELTYRPVAVLFAMTALMAMGVSYATSGDPFTVRAAEWFISFSMVVLALLKLQNVETFATMFLNYDLLAKRWVPYSYIYPYAEGLAGLLMVAGVATWFSAPLALFISTVGAVSVFKAVYIDKRELKCACVGGSTRVPLGFVSLTENLMMMAMAIWMGLSWLGYLPGSPHGM